MYLSLRISHGSGGNGPALMAAAVAVIIQLVSATLREHAHNALALFGRHAAKPVSMLQKAPCITQNSCKSSSSSSRCIRISPSKHSARQISPPTTDPIGQLASPIGCWWVCATRLIVGGCVKEEEEEKNQRNECMLILYSQPQFEMMECDMGMTELLAPLFAAAAVLPSFNSQRLIIVVIGEMTLR